MVVRFNAEPVDMIVTVVYTPTLDYDDQDVEEIYDQIEEAWLWAEEQWL